MEQKKFQRNKESFTCEHCGTKVEGTGYTNHCPECFTSKHVDDQPGDRQSECLGSMPTIRVEYEDGEWKLLQHCLKCQHQRYNKVQPEDNMDQLAELNKQLQEKFMKG